MLYVTPDEIIKIDLSPAKRTKNRRLRAAFSLWIRICGSPELVYTIVCHRRNIIACRRQLVEAASLLDGTGIAQ